MTAPNDIAPPENSAAVSGSDQRLVRHYGCIVADPPWGYEEKGSPWYSGSEPAYALMKLEEIKALPVADLAAKDAHLYLWAVLPMMAEAYQVVEAWGFKPDTILTWCKPGVGLGGGWRGNTEHLIVARRGEAYMNPTCRTCGLRARGKTRKCECPEPAWHVRGQAVALKKAFKCCGRGTWYQAPRGKHSEKPDVFMDMVEEMSHGPYLELFSRNPRLGWHAWGNQIASDICMPNSQEQSSRSD